MNTNEIDDLIDDLYAELTEEVYVVMVYDIFCKNYSFLWGYFKDLRRAKMLVRNMQESWRQRIGREWHPPKIEKRRVSSYCHIIRDPLTPYEQHTFKRLEAMGRRNLYIFEPE